MKLLAFCAAFFLASCGAESEHALTQQGSAPTCRAPGMTTGIEAGICSADPSALRDALFNDQQDSSGEARRALISGLQRIWQADQTYGAGLPWDALRGRRFRSILAEQLVPAIRNQEIESPLREFQEFAVQFVNSAQTDAEQLDGLRLIGLADTAEQIPLLRAVILSPDGTPTRRDYAIDALGMICAPEAMIALKEFETRRNDHTFDARRLETAMQTRQRLEKSWCDQVEPLPDSAKIE